MRRLTSLIILIISSSIVLSCTASPQSTSSADPLFKTISKIIELENISKDAIEHMLGITFYEEKLNPYYKRYLSKESVGIISKVQFSEPKKTAKSREKRLILNIDPAAKITYYNDIKPRYGAGKISDIIPKAQPEGLISFEHSVGKQTIIFQCTAKTYKLVSVVIVRPT